MKLPASGNPATQREVLAGVDEEEARPDELHLAPLLAPRWAPNVVVVSRHMPTGRLELGPLCVRWLRKRSMREDAHKQKVKHTAIYPGSGPS